MKQRITALAEARELSITELLMRAHDAYASPTLQHCSGTSEILETWSSKSRSAPPEASASMVGILLLKLILAENTEDAYLIIASRFNSFRSSLVLSISSAAFPTMT